MARLLSQRSQDVIVELLDVLTADGDDADLQAMRQRYPDIPRSTFFRLLDAAKKRFDADELTGAGKRKLQRAQAKINRSISSPPPVLTREIVQHLPTAPSPSVVAAMDPEERAKVFDFVSYFRSVVRDAEMLRAKAVRMECGVEVLANPMLMDLSIRRRLQVMDTYLSSMDQLYNMEKIQELYSTVIDEVGKADSGVQAAILARLRDLNNARGLTIAAVL